MKKFFLNLSMSAKMAIMTIIAFFLGQSSYAFAPSTGGEISTTGTNILSGVSAQMSGLGDALATVVQYGLLAGALVTLVLLVFNLLKGERESATKLGWWVFGLSFGFAAIAVIRSIINTDSAAAVF